MRPKTGFNLLTRDFMTLVLRVKDQQFREKAAMLRVIVTGVVASIFGLVFGRRKALGVTVVMMLMVAI